MQKAVKSPELIQHEMKLVSKRQERKQEEVSLQLLKSRLFLKMQQAKVDEPAKRTVA